MNTEVVYVVKDTNKQKQYETWFIDYKKLTAFKTDENLLENEHKTTKYIGKSIKEFLSGKNYGAFTEEKEKNREFSFRPRCKYGSCFHPDEQHEEGCCMVITQVEYKDEETEKKYCPCKGNNGENIRTFEKLGYMEAKTHDQMITKKCSNCKEILLIHKDEEYCITCRRNI